MFKNLKKIIKVKMSFVKGNNMEDIAYTMRFDGGCAPTNPGPCAGSYVIFDKNVRELGIPDLQKSSRRALLEFADGTSYMADLVLVAIGRKPNSIINTKLFQIPIDKEYLFLIGDLVNGNFRQLSISAGDGIKAAMKIASKINKI